MESILVVGKKELLAWCSSISGKPTPSFESLRDGSSILKIFARIWPRVVDLRRIRWKAMPKNEVEVKLNWDAIRAAMVDLKLPMKVFDKKGLMSARFKQCYTFLVMLYFLQNLSENHDFSVDFAHPIDGDLASFLQSPASVECLARGGGLRIDDLNNIPVDSIDLLPSSLVSPSAASASAAAIPYEPQMFNAQSYQQQYVQQAQQHYQQLQQQQQQQQQHHDMYDQSSNTYGAEEDDLLEFQVMDSESPQKQSYSYSLPQYHQSHHQQEEQQQHHQQQPQYGQQQQHEYQHQPIPQHEEQRPSASSSSSSVLPFSWSQSHSQAQHSSVENISSVSPGASALLAGNASPVQDHSNPHSHHHHHDIQSQSHQRHPSARPQHQNQQSHRPPPLDAFSPVQSQSQQQQQPLLYSPIPSSSASSLQQQQQQQQPSPLQLQQSQQPQQPQQQQHQFQEPEDSGSQPMSPSISSPLLSESGSNSSKPPARALSPAAEHFAAGGSVARSPSASVSFQPQNNNHLRRFIQQQQHKHLQSDKRDSPPSVDDSHNNNNASNSYSNPSMLSEGSQTELTSRKVEQTIIRNTQNRREIDDLRRELQDAYSRISDLEAGASSPLDSSSAHAAQSSSSFSSNSSIIWRTRGGKEKGELLLSKLRFENESLQRQTQALKQEKEYSTRRYEQRIRELRSAHENELMFLRDSHQSQSVSQQLNIFSERMKDQRDYASELKKLRDEMDFEADRLRESGLVGDEDAVEEEMLRLRQSVAIQSRQIRVMDDNNNALQEAVDKLGQEYQASLQKIDELHAGYRAVHREEEAIVTEVEATVAAASEHLAASPSANANSLPNALALALARLLAESRFEMEEMRASHVRELEELRHEASRAVAAAASSSSASSSSGSTSDAAQQEFDLQQRIERLQDELSRLKRANVFLRERSVLFDARNKSLGVPSESIRRIRGSSDPAAPTTSSASAASSNVWTPNAFVGTAIDEPESLRGQILHMSQELVSMLHAVGTGASSNSKNSPALSVAAAEDLVKKLVTLFWEVICDQAILQQRIEDARESIVKWSSDLTVEKAAHASIKSELEAKLASANHQHRVEVEHLNQLIAKEKPILLAKLSVQEDTIRELRHRMEDRSSHMSAVIEQAYVQHSARFQSLNGILDSAKEEVSLLRKQEEVLESMSEHQQRVIELTERLATCDDYDEAFKLNEEREQENTAIAAARTQLHALQNTLLQQQHHHASGSSSSSSSSSISSDKVFSRHEVEVLIREATTLLRTHLEATNQELSSLRSQMDTRYKQEFDSLSLRCKELELELSLSADRLHALNTEFTSVAAERDIAMKERNEIKLLQNAEILKLETQLHEFGKYLEEHDALVHSIGSFSASLLLADNNGHSISSIASSRLRSPLAAGSATPSSAAAASAAAMDSNRPFQSLLKELLGSSVSDNSNSGKERQQQPVVNVPPRASSSSPLSDGMSPVVPYPESSSSLMRDQSHISVATFASPSASASSTPSAPFSVSLNHHHASSSSRVGILVEPSNDDPPPSMANVPSLPSSSSSVRPIRLVRSPRSASPIDLPVSSSVPTPPLTSASPSALSPLLHHHQQQPIVPSPLSLSAPPQQDASELLPLQNMIRPSLLSIPSSSSAPTPGASSSSRFGVGSPDSILHNRIDDLVDADDFMIDEDDLIAESTALEFLRSSAFAPPPVASARNPGVTLQLSNSNNHPGNAPAVATWTFKAPSSSSLAQPQ